MGRTVRRVASIALPVAGAAFGLPALLGGALLPTATAATQAGLGGALLGGAGGALGGGGLGDALTGAGLGGVGGFAGAGGFDAPTSSPGVTTLTGGTVPGTPLATAQIRDITDPLALSGFGAGAPNITSPIVSGGAAAAPLVIGGGTSIPSGALGGQFAPPTSGDSLLEGARNIGNDFIQPGGMGNALGQVFSGIQGDQAYREMADAVRAAQMQNLQNLAPQQQAGFAATNQLSGLLGLDPTQDQEAILEQLRSTPGFEFNLEQGQRALERSQAARGGLLSGRAVQEAQRLGQGLADQAYNDYLRALQQQSAQGLAATQAGIGAQSQIGDITAAQLFAQQQNQDRTLAQLLGAI